MPPTAIDEAEEFSIAPGTMLFALDRVRYLGNVPIAIDFTRIPADLVPDFENRLPHRLALCTS